MKTLRISCFVTFLMSLFAAEMASAQQRRYIYYYPNSTSQCHQCPPAAKPGNNLAVPLAPQKPATPAIRATGKPYHFDKDHYISASGVKTPYSKHAPEPPALKNPNYQDRGREWARTTATVRFRYMPNGSSKWETRTVEVTQSAGVGAAGGREEAKDYLYGELLNEATNDDRGREEYNSGGDTNYNGPAILLNQIYGKSGIVGEVFVKPHSADTKFFHSEREPADFQNPKIKE